jgi:hypothetical protein
MHRIILSSVASLALPYFSTLSHKRHELQKKKVIEHKLCVLIFFTNLSKTFLILRRIQRDITTNVRSSLCKVPVILVTSEGNWNFLARFSKEYSISNFMKICPVGVELFHADGQADRQT